MAGAEGFGNTFINKVIGIPKGQLAFRPWWHEMEDYLVYSLAMVGIVLAPTTMALKIGAIMDCNFCQKDFCGNGRINGVDPKFSWKYVRKWCADNAVDHLILYFPIIILIEAALVFAVERFFRKVTASGDKMLMFYSHVVKKNVCDDVGAYEEGAKEFNAQEEKKMTAEEYIAQQTVYDAKTNIFSSMMARTMTELFIIIAFVVGIFYADSVRPLNFDKEDTIVDYCELKTLSSNTSSYWYECSGQPTGLYRSVGFILALVNGLHILTSIYHLLWMIIPGISQMDKLISKIRELDPDVLVKLSKARDVKLLVKLLAERIGVPAALQVLCFLDHEFLKRLTPRLTYVADNSLEVGVGNPHILQLEVSVGNPHILQLLSAWDPLYVVEGGGELSWCPATGRDKINVNKGDAGRVVVVRLVLQARTIATEKADIQILKSASKGNTDIIKEAAEGNTDMFKEDARQTSTVIKDENTEETIF